MHQEKSGNPDLLSEQDRFWTLILHAGKKVNTFVLIKTDSGHHSGIATMCGLFHLICLSSD
jgi:hypothetical protein